MGGVENRRGHKDLREEVIAVGWGKKGDGVEWKGWVDSRVLTGSR